MLESLRRLSDHQQCHVRMLDTAELGTLRAVRPGLLCRESQLVLPPRDEILLSSKIGRPEGMDDIRGAEVQPYDPTYGNMNFISRRKDLIGLGIEVRHFPPESCSLAVSPATESG